MHKGDEFSSRSRSGFKYSPADTAQRLDASRPNPLVPPIHARHPTNHITMSAKSGPHRTLKQLTSFYDIHGHISRPARTFS